MAQIKTIPNGKQRNVIASLTLIFSASAITVLAVFTIIQRPERTLTIFNIVLPVFASWVGTILAFYFGRENFESANQQVRELVQKIMPDDHFQKAVTSIMRPLIKMVYFQIGKNKVDKDIKLSELMKKYGKDITRLPILEFDKKPKYIVHESSINKHIAGGGKESDTLEKLIAAQKKVGSVFGFNRGFIVVSEKTLVGDAKRRMEEIPTCQDIFITKGGSADEPLLGWISNVRMGKILET